MSDHLYTPTGLCIGLHTSAALDQCQFCNSKFVFPLDWSEEGPRHWRIVLRCPECESRREGVFHQTAVERLDDELQRPARRSTADDAREHVRGNRVLRAGTRRRSSMCRGLLMSGRERFWMAVAAAVAVLCIVQMLATETASASNASVSRQRMAVALFAEYGHGFEYDGYRRGYERQLKMKAEGRWVPVELTVSCRRQTCTGRIVAEEAHSTVIVDHASFVGRKGTYHETGWKRVHPFVNPPKSSTEVQNVATPSPATPSPESSRPSEVPPEPSRSFACEEPTQAEIDVILEKYSQSELEAGIEIETSC